MPSYRMTPARKAALKKAQVASARKRRGSGKAKASARTRIRSVSAKSSTKRRGKATPTSIKRRRRAAVAAVGAVGAAAGAAYVYKNREKLVISKKAEFDAIRAAKAQAKAKGKKLGKAQIRKVRMDERVGHATRSTLRVREYTIARNMYKTISKKSKGRLNMRPVNHPNNDGTKYTSNGSFAAKSFHTLTADQKLYTDYQQVRYFQAYRRDVHSRALARHARMNKKKRQFGYDSGKRLLVSRTGQVKKAFW